MSGHMRTTWKIVFGSIIALLVSGFILAMIVPSLPRYNFASVNDARAFTHIEGTEIVAELGDTNGPYRLKGGVNSGTSKPFDFGLTFNGHTTNWSHPVSSHMWYVVTIFENRRGNQFAVVCKMTN